MKILIITNRSPLKISSILTLCILMPCHDYWIQLRDWSYEINLFFVKLKLNYHSAYVIYQHIFFLHNSEPSSPCFLSK